jgi:hypothetical protein
MANDDTTNNGTVRKLVLLCISLTAAINMPVFYVLTEHASEISEIRSSIVTKTQDRYYRRDAAAHEELDNQRLENVYFRFKRDEAQINECMREIEKLKERK